MNKSAATEKDLQSRIFRDIGSRSDVRLFRNNVGVAWMGKAVMIQQPRVATLKPGDVVIRGARRVNFGLHKGSGDLIGWRSLLITPRMVGRRIAQFLSMEIKTPAGSVTEDQEIWAVVVDKSGGCAGVVRSEVDARQLVESGV